MSTCETQSSTSSSEAVLPILEPHWRLAKRGTDLLLLAVTLPLWLPLLLLVAGVVRAFCGSPVLYSQMRLGRDGRSFRCWKFRTMVRDADLILHEVLTADTQRQREWQDQQKLRLDPRVTPLGRMLRATSLDELPQVWNVLCGDMALVGPRPIVPDEVALYGEAFDFYRMVRPGMTGIWQVSGRNNLSYRQRVEMDRRYVEQWSIAMDMTLVFQTFRAVIEGDGAC